jgi:hypothetical protein
LRLHRPAAASLVSWWALCLLLALPAWWQGWVPLGHDSSTWPATAQAWTLHPSMGLQQPAWVWWTTAWLHGSAQHLWRNLAGVLLLAWLGHLGQVPLRSTLAWALAWPLTHLGMLWRPELQAYIGLSGVLHAGVAVVCVHLLTCDHPPIPRLFAWGLSAGLVTKIIMENPCGPALIHPIGTDIAVAPWAHLAGSVAGATLGLLSLVHKGTRPVKTLT